MTPGRQTDAGDASAAVAAIGWLDACRDVIDNRRPTNGDCVLKRGWVFSYPGTVTNVGYRRWVT